MSVEMKTLTIGGTTYEIVDETARSIKDSNDYLNATGLNASEQVTVANDSTSMTLYTNGLGSDSGNVWIDQSGEAFFTEVNVGTKDNYKPVATSADIPGMATTSKLGTVMVDGNNGIGVNTENGNLFIKGAETNEIDGKEHSYKPITPDNLDYAVKAALVNNALDLSDSERTAALAWLGSMSSVCQRKSSGDITDLLGADSGKYMVTSAVTGMPIEDKWWFVDVSGSGTTDMSIIAHPVDTDDDPSTPKMYVRICANGTWGGWFKVLTENEYGNTAVGGQFTADWLQTLADTHRSEPAEKIAVLDNSGWVYHRTPAEALSDMGGAPANHTHAEPNTDYTTVRARGIALAQDEAISVPDGCLCGVYTIS